MIHCNTCYCNLSVVVTLDHEIHDAVMPTPTNLQNQNLNLSGLTAKQTTTPHSAQRKSPLVATPKLEEIPSTQLSRVAVLSDHQKQGMTQYRESREGGWNQSSSHDTGRRGAGTGQGRWTMDSQLSEPYRHHFPSHSQYTDCKDSIDDKDSDQRVNSEETTQQWVPSCRQSYIPSHDSSSTPCQYNIPNTWGNQHIPNTFGNQHIPFTQGNQYISNTQGNDSVVARSTRIPLRTRQSYLPFHSGLQNCTEGGEGVIHNGQQNRTKGVEEVIHNGQQNRTKGGEAERWPGYDSPPMDIEYEFEPIQVHVFSITTIYIYYTN